MTWTVDYATRARIDMRRLRETHCAKRAMSSEEAAQLEALSNDAARESGWHAKCSRASSEEIMNTARILAAASLPAMIGCGGESGRGDHESSFGELRGDIELMVNARLAPGAEQALCGHATTRADSMIDGVHSRSAHTPHRIGVYVFQAGSEEHAAADDWSRDCDAQAIEAEPIYETYETVDGAMLPEPLHVAAGDVVFLRYIAINPTPDYRQAHAEATAMHATRMGPLIGP